MKATEQLSAMEMMGVDPLKRVVTPRLWAGIISMPILAILFSLVGIWGGAFVAIDLVGIDDGAYWGNMQAAVRSEERRVGKSVDRGGGRSMKKKKNKS